MTDTETDVAVDPRVLRALGHPLRQRILHVLNIRVASPSALSQELGERLANVSYHVKILLENDAIELVKTEPVRGALEHFYRATMRPHLDDEHWSKLPVSSRRELFDTTLQKAWEHMAAAAQGQGLDDPRTHVSFTSLELDDEAYDELAAELAEVLETATRLEAESHQRRVEADGGGEGHSTVLVVAHFHRPGSARDGNG